MVNEVVVLALLQNGPKHGYQILKDAKRLVGPEETFDTKRLYSTLKRLEQDHAIVADPEPSPVVGAPNRKVYHITPHGADRLVSMVADPTSATDRRRFFLTLALFQIIGDAAQQRLLRERLEWLRLEAQHLREVGEYPQHTPWSRKVVAFQLTQISQEIAWLATLHPSIAPEVQK